MSSFKLPAGGAQAVMTLCRKPMHRRAATHAIEAHHAIDATRSIPPRSP